MNKFSLDREFIRWFYEDHYPDQLNNRAGVMQRTPYPNVEQRDYWMRQAYKAGAQAMWHEIDASLLAWACAVEGLNPEMLEPAQVYDRARENLWYRVYTQLELFND